MININLLDPIIFTKENLTNQNLGLILLQFAIIYYSENVSLKTNCATENKISY